ncbi:MAG: hypothetical protein K9M55_09465 [Candidatus Marinimicrobia bacterium]|nr:hypothetical protein [Candidatus Neomarinimicrobiota bacterium]MCF7922914.1 hypothetical protein [Candidatus Neomarinimicrobiota bacterium]
MRKVKLPESFAPNRCKDLLRLGGQHDGGYLVSKNDIKKTEVLLAFGINADWNFEKDFNAVKSVPTYAYDASTTFKLFIKKSFGALFRLELGKAITFPFKYLSLKRFFSGKRKHIRKFVGLSYENSHVSMGEVLEELNFSNIYVKMDIEGSEYRCLNPLIEHQNRICGAVIEFHNVDLHMERIKKFIAAFDLPIAHIHANNYQPNTEDGVPLVIEITFSRFGSFESNLASLPHELDGTNKPSAEEIQITFS